MNEMSSHIQHNFEEQPSSDNDYEGKLKDYLKNQELKREKEELKEENKKLTEEQRTNPLTGLPNQKALEEFISIFDARPHDVIATYIDLKNFGEINRNLGHKKADEKVHEFGQYLKDEIRQSDLLFHPHGDEFVLLSIKRNKKGEISPEEGLGHHLQIINQSSEIKFDFVSITFDKTKHKSLGGAINEADKILMRKKELAREEKSQPNLV